MQDVHTHINNGDYTVEYLERYILQAVEAGLSTLHILEHSHEFAEFIPMYEQVASYNEYFYNWINGKKKKARPLNDYKELIDIMRGRNYPIKILYGLEICYFPGREDFVRGITGDDYFDFLTGSVHYVDGFGFDHKVIAEDTELWENIDVNSLYRRYYEIMEELISSGLFDIVAHPDSIKCSSRYPDFDMTGIYESIGRTAAKHGIKMEQSGGLALNYHLEEKGMNERLLRILLKNGVEVVTASDAHRPEDVGANIRELDEIINKNWSDSNG